MADDIKVPKSTEPTDPDVATDEVGGRHYQWMKLAVGADGVAVPVDSGNPFPVADATAEAKLTAIEAKLPALSSGAMPVADSTVWGLLGRILNVLLAPLGFDKSLQRYRQTAIIESGTVTGLTNLNGFPADMMVRAQVNAAWALNVRARIT